MTSSQIIILLLTGIVVSKTLIGILLWYLRKANKSLRNDRLTLTNTNIELKASLEKIDQQHKELSNAENFKLKILSIAAHDLRTPFSSLSMLLKFSEANNLSEAEMTEALNNIRSQLDVSQKMLDDVLLWTAGQLKDEQWGKQDFDLTRQIESQIALFDVSLRKKNLAIRCEIPARATTYGNPDVFDFVLRNYLSNAIKYSPENTEILIGYSCTATSSHGQVYVKDSGRGMEKDLLEIVNKGVPILDNTHPRVENSMGIGLSLCQELIRQANWKMQAESNVGNGCVFSLFLPIRQIS